MDKVFERVLNGQAQNHLLPFLWMHRGEREKLPEMIETIYRHGARAFCVESRPHEGFGRDDWWQDMDVVLSEAQKRGMKVWILDDKHFPTGFANGLVREKYPERRKWHLIEEHTDVVGPARENAILLVSADAQYEETLLGVFACRRDAHDEVLSGEMIDLTAHVKGRYVYWDIPEGVWRVFSLFKSRRGTEDGKQDYIHMIDPDSVRVLIEAVYEPHFAHYGHLFGTVIAGFFSDEPSFGNVSYRHGGADSGFYDHTVGQPGLALPWTDECLAELHKRLGGNVLARLPGLWYPRETPDPEIRTAYMDTVTSLWQRHFSEQLGAWCRDHHVEYIGHIIEDMNAHARLGCSGGHYFRSLAGQDMAGIDVVLHQILPGIVHQEHAASAGGGYLDPHFFHYVLGRLAASLCHIEPRMKNRAMCEVFGAFGWAEGVPFMKRLMDHLLVRGLNMFVPHAYSVPYPDPDCPPHFNGGGDNPESDAFGELMRYVNDTADLLAGTEQVQCAILYHAEAEWAGQGCMLTQDAAVPLYDAFLNYDILPFDALRDKSTVRDHALHIGAMRYPCLVVPWAAWLPEDLLRCLEGLEKQGLPLFFINSRPEGAAFGTVLKPDELPAAVRALSPDAPRTEKPFPLLRHMHMRRDGLDAFMFVNESQTKDFDGTLLLPLEGGGALRRGLDKWYRVSAPQGRLELRLDKGEAALVLFGDIGADRFSPEPITAFWETPKLEWRLKLIPAHGKGPEKTLAPEGLFNVTGPDGDDSFSGRMIYETVLPLDRIPRVLDLGLVGECAKAEVGGRSLGWRVAPPYTYALHGEMQKGENLLRIEVVNSLVHEVPDWFSTYMQIPPSGLLGPVRLGY